MASRLRVCKLFSTIQIKLDGNQNVKNKRKDTKELLLVQLIIDMFLLCIDKNIGLQAGASFWD